MISGMGRPAANIRNFVIIAHVDHGKSTLADRLLELTATVEPRKMRPQYLDQMELERERGITIKMAPVRMVWRPNHAEIQNPKPPPDFAGTTCPTRLRLLEVRRESRRAGETLNKSEIPNPKSQNDLGFRASDLGLAGSGFILNLIDTPGHADFSYEVSRALAAVEGAILLVDAAQGVEAQTLAVLESARKEGLTVIPAINKIDLPQARLAETEREIIDRTGCRADEILRLSAKTGEGVPEVLAAVVGRIPPPEIRPDSSAPRALIFDSHFDEYRGVIAHLRVVDGEFRRGETVSFLATGRRAEVLELGHFLPELTPAPALSAGEIGYLATGLKDPDTVRVGDTIAKLKSQSSKFETVEDVGPLPGYREPQPVLFAGLYPDDADSYARLLDAMKKIKLNDAALTFAPDSSAALGRGFRIGFLGRLHMEIFGERLAREYGLAPRFTVPAVAYHVRYRDGREERISSAHQLGSTEEVVEIREPWITLEVMAPLRCFGAVMALLGETRGRHRGEQHLGQDRLMISWETPLADIVIDFADRLKGVTAGYGSFSYELAGERPGDLVRLDILIAGEPAEPLSRVVPREQAYREGRAMVAKLKDLLPRQVFAVAIQAAVGGRVMSRETLPARAKNVTAHLYGGDRTRKMKLWERQKRGKERLKKTGRVLIPPAVYRALLHR